jgi:hypothetical protein
MKLIEKLRGIAQEAQRDFRELVDEDDFELVRNADGKMVNPKTGKAYEGGEKA